MNNKPPFQVSNKVLTLLQDIAYELGILSGAKLSLPAVKLRKSNQIKTIHSSLAIEGNSLSLDQITNIIDGKPVLGSKNDIIEVNNAIKLYNNLHKLNPLSIDYLLEAHRLLMQELIVDNGYFRASGVGIFKGDEITHIAPKASRVPLLMDKLFQFIKQNKDIPWLIKACVFHYELAFIHPFSDGNGRMGRLWQQLLLMKADPIFKYIPVEVLIKNEQSEYYNVLAECDKAGESTLFIEFMATQILKTLQLYVNNVVSPVKTPKSRLEFAKIKLPNSWFSRKDYILLHKDISSASASRDLIFGVKEGILTYKGIKNQTCYKFQ
ncbi:Fic family protein [Candidatus Tisiphia endosymbiont of Micropterix aruncella]|uniref:Fic family protein n=1 Tax=Candidatus Tisiphia endosymbiont of Micropterix aruncella TaxID=3066271 RepID=UPI003AA8B9D2